MEFNPTCNYPLWTMEEDKAFENGLAIYSGHICPWEKIAVAVPGRTVDEINNQFEVFKSDVSAIESGNIPLPYYAEDRAVCKEKSSTSNAERKRGIPWTKEEHRLFVYGLEKYGKGDWRSISRYYVRTRTPTQVASHAQKFFKRLDNVEKSRKRTSIHDITVLDEGKLLNKKVLIIGQPSSEGGETSRGGTRKKTRTYENFGVAIKLLRSSGAKKGNVSTAQRLSTEEPLGARGVGLSAHSMPNLHGISFSEGPSTRPMIRAGDGGWIAPSMPNRGVSFSEDPSIQQMIGASDGGSGTHLMAHLQGVPVPKVAHSRRTIGAANGCLISSHQGLSIPQAPVTGHMFGAADVGFIGYPFPTHQHILNHQAPRSAEIFGATGFCAPIVSIQQNMPTLQWPVPQQMMGDGGADFSDSLIADTEEGFDVGKYLVDFDPSEPDFDLSLLGFPDDVSENQEPIAPPVLAPGCVPPQSSVMYGFGAFVFDAPLG